MVAAISPVVLGAEFAVGTAGMTVAAGCVAITTGAQAESNTLTSSNTEKSKLRVFIFFSIGEIFFDTRIVASQPNKKLTFPAKSRNWGIKALSLLSHGHRMKTVNYVRSTLDV
jgi:hypothetical protein